VKGKIALILSVLFILCSCDRLPNASVENTDFSQNGVWFTYNEINDMLASLEGFETQLNNAVENCRKLNITNVYIHTRAYCDSLYPSSFFPIIKSAERFEYDVFLKIIEAFHKVGIKVHAWVNPYRVLTSSDNINKLCEQSPAYKWLKDENVTNDKNVCFYNGIYLNPAETEVQNLILNGIREIITNYKVDGIHFDDYFYPTKSEDFDKESYKIYKNGSENPLSLDDWRRQNVNGLISGCYSLIKKYDKDIVFSVSPAASIEKNYTDLYADVRQWIFEGYIDVVIPQLYFGYDYSDNQFKFNNILKEWLSICDKKVDLLIGLAAYKIGTHTEADGKEWQTQTDIIARQVKECLDSGNVKGCIFFSYSSLFSEEKLNIIQRENLLQFMENISLVKQNE